MDVAAQSAPQLRKHTTKWLMERDFLFVPADDRRTDAPSRTEDASATHDNKKRTREKFAAHLKPASRRKTTIMSVHSGGIHHQEYHARGKTLDRVHAGWLALAFVVIFIPMASVALLLLGLTNWHRIRVFDRATATLPVTWTPPSDSFYPLVSQGQFSLVASWASTLANIVATPFVFLFSFLVARDLVLTYRVEYSTDIAHHEPHVRTIQSYLRAGSPEWAWKWLKDRKSQKGRAMDQPIKMTLIGLSISMVLMYVSLVLNVASCPTDTALVF